MASFSTSGTFETDAYSSSNYDDGKAYPKVPHMKSEEARMETFSNWPSTSPVKPDDLVEAGLFHLPGASKKDLVQCFCCGVMLSDWVEGDDPWAEHAKFYPKCSYITGHDVGNIPLKLCNPKDEDPLKKLEKLQNEKLCKVCMDNDVSIVFTPCGHLVTCKRCSDSVDKCPMCSALITKKIKIYC